MRLTVYLPSGRDDVLEGIPCRRNVRGGADIDEVAGAIRLSVPATINGHEYPPGTLVLVTRQALVVEVETGRVIWRPQRFVLPGVCQVLSTPSRPVNADQVIHVVLSDLAILCGAGVDE